MFSVAFYIKLDIDIYVCPNITREWSI